MPDPVAAFDRERLLVMCAPNGARRTKADHPALPLSPGELAREASALRAAGVGAVHLHVRDAEGRHTLSVPAYRAALDAIRAQVGDALVLQVTTEAVGVYTPAEQVALVRRLRPEAVSLALRELLSDPRQAGDVEAFFATLPGRGTWAQYIVYSPAELERLDDLRRRGMLGIERPSCLLVLGNYAKGRSGSLDDLRRFAVLPALARFSWSACCFGPTEQAVLTEAARLGGHVRLGFENNTAHADGRPAAGNAELIEAFLAQLPPDTRPIASAVEVRTGFGVPSPL